MNQQQAIELMGQLAIRLYLERIGRSEAREVRLMDSPDRPNGFFGPLFYNFILPHDLRAFIQYTDIVQLVN